MPLHHITCTPLAVPTCWHVASPLVSLPWRRRAHCPHTSEHAQEFLRAWEGAPVNTGGSTE